MRSIFYFLMCVTSLMGCNDTKLCRSSNFFTTYKEKYQLKDTFYESVKVDLKIKEDIFSKLCIPGDRKKVLLIESQPATKSSFSSGIVFVYDDSSTWHYAVVKGILKTGSGYGNNLRLFKILNLVRRDFNTEGAILEKKYNKPSVMDAENISMILFNKEPKLNISTFRFKYVLMPN